MHLFSSGKAAFVKASICLIFLIAAAQASDWLQWGGPSRNFKTDSKGLANSWPESGPRRLWSRPLGEGHSAILIEGSKLYTMYGRGEQEVVIAMDAVTGKTLWEYAYDSSSAGMNYEFGKGPHATPLIVGDFIFTAGSLGQMLCLNKNTGKLTWSHDLWKELKGTVEDRGYSCSPIAYKDTVIMTVGGAGQTIVAFNQKDGRIVWKKHDLMTSPSSHLLINVDGQDQLVAFLGKQIIGIDPANGDLLWSHTHETDWGLNISTPVWGEDNLLFFSSAYNGGSRVLRLTRTGGKTTATQVWFHRRLRVHHGTIIRLGDLVYGSSGDFGPAFLSAVEVKTGRIVWQDRSFPKASFVYADGKFIILDEDGNLTLAAPTAEGLKVLSKASVLQSISWTAPTLAGTKLYIRDRRNIAAFDLS